RSSSIIVRSTCWPASRQSPKNAVRVSWSTSSSGNGTCTVATGGDVCTSPANDPVRLLFMAAPFRLVSATTVLTGRRKEPPLFSQAVNSTGAGTSPLNWPARVAAILGAKWGIDAVGVQLELDREIREQLAELAAFSVEGKL